MSDNNPYGHEDCYMNQSQPTSEIGHNGIGLPTQRTPYQSGYEDAMDRGIFASGTPSPENFDEYHRGYREGHAAILACIFQRSMNNGDDMTTRPHKITLHMSGVDLIRLVQLAMYPTGERQ